MPTPAPFGGTPFSYGSEVYVGVPYSGPLADGEPDPAGHPPAAFVGRRTIRTVIRTGERGAR